MDNRTIYTTFPNTEEARAVSWALLEERLVACANVIPGITSMYHWEGNIQEDSEVVVLMKTTAALCHRAIDRLKELHSYDCPCAVAWEITAGNAEYLDWLGNETAE